MKPRFYFNFLLALSFLAYLVATSSSSSGDLEQAQSMKNTGKLYKNIGNYKNALAFYEHALANLQKVYNNSYNLDVATTLLEIGNLHEKQGEHAKALHNQLNALEMLNKGARKKGDMLEKASALGSVGNTYQSLGEFSKSIEYYEQALAMLRRLYKNSNHKQTAKLLNRLGISYQSIGRFEAAMAYYQESLSMKHSLYGGDYVKSDVAAILNNIAGTHASLGDLQNALSLYLDSYNMKMKINKGADHLSAAESLHKIGNVYEKMGKYVQALEYQHNCLKIRESLLKVIFFCEFLIDSIFNYYFKEQRAHRDCRVFGRHWRFVFKAWRGVKSVDVFGASA
jgi:tetratricopeptide (TPR) repeat protein